MANVSVVSPPVDIKDAIDGIYFDSINGVSGTASSVGTADNPVNNWADAKVLAAARKTSTIKLVHGVITITANESGYHFIGSGYSEPFFPLLDNYINIVGVHTLSQCSFKEINISGANATLLRCGHFLRCAYIEVDTIDESTNFIQCGEIYADDISSCAIFDSCYTVSVANNIEYCWSFTDIVYLSATLLDNSSDFVRCSDIDCTTINRCSNFTECGRIVATTMTDGYDFRGCREILITTITVVTFPLVRFADCGHITAVLDYNHLNITGDEFEFRTGHLTLRNMDNGVVATITGHGLRVTAEASCDVTSMLTLYGDITLTNLSTLQIASARGFQEQADVAVNINATAGGETDVLNMAVAGTRYLVRHLRLKCADPGANTVTVRLYELVNDVLTQVDSFDITAANFATHHSLMDMFGLHHLAGDRLQVTARASGGGPYAVTGQYSYSTAT